MYVAAAIQKNWSRARSHLVPPSYNVAFYCVSAPPYAQFDTSLDPNHYPPPSPSHEHLPLTRLPLQITPPTGRACRGYGVTGFPSAPSARPSSVRITGSHPSASPSPTIAPSLPSPNAGGSPPIPSTRSAGAWPLSSAPLRGGGSRICRRPTCSRGQKRGGRRIGA